jgi:hypothetical protein
MPPVGADDAWCPEPAVATSPLGAALAADAVARGIRTIVGRPIWYGAVHSAPGPGPSQRMLRMRWPAVRDSIPGWRSGDASVPPPGSGAALITLLPNSLAPSERPHRAARTSAATWSKRYLSRWRRPGGGRQQGRVAVPGRRVPRWGDLVGVRQVIDSMFRYHAGACDGWPA